MLLKFYGRNNMLKQSSRNSIGKNVFYAFSAQGTQFLLSCLMALIVPKILGVEQFGYWQLFIFYIQYGGFMHLGLIDGIYLKEGGKSYGDLQYENFASQFVKLIVFVSLIMVPFFVIGINEDDSNRRYVVLASCLYVLIRNLVSYFSYLFQATNRIRDYSWGQMSFTLTFILGLFVFVILDINNSFRPYVVAYVLCELFALLYFIKNNIEIVKRFSFSLLTKYLKETWDYIKIGIILMLANITGMLIVGIGRYAIDKEWGVVVFGIVSLSLMYVNFFLLFLSQVSMVLFPQLRRYRPEKVVAFYGKYRTILFLLVPTFLLFIIPFVFLIKVWLPSYSDAIEYMIYLLPIIVFEGKMQLLFITLFKVYNDVKNLLFCNVVALLTIVVLLVISIQVFDSVVAVALSMLISICIRSLIAEFFISRKLDKPMFRYCFPELFAVGVFIWGIVCLGYTIGCIIYISFYICYLFFYKGLLRELRIKTIS